MNNHDKKMLDTFKYMNCTHECLTVFSIFLTFKRQKNKLISKKDMAEMTYFQNYMNNS